MNVIMPIDHPYRPGAVNLRSVLTPGGAGGCVGRGRLSLPLPFVLLLSALTLAATSAEPPPAAIATLPDGVGLLQEVVAGLPKDPLQIKARLEARNRLDDLDKVRLAAMSLDWRGGAIQAEYTICDAFGGKLARLEVRRTPGGALVYAGFQGPELKPVEHINLGRPLEDTDINWLDLSLAFLWWPGARTTGTEHVKGRRCYVVEVPVPVGTDAQCATVRLWIEAQVRVLLQAEALDAGRQRVRALRVKSFKKIQDLWMLQDLEVETYPSRHRTLLRVQEVRCGDRIIQGAGEPAAVVEPLPALPPEAPVGK